MRGKHQSIQVHCYPAWNRVMQSINPTAGNMIAEKATPHEYKLSSPMPNATLQRDECSRADPLIFTGRDSV